MNSIKTNTAAGRCGTFAAATAGLWLLLLWPAWLVADGDGLVGVSIGAGLCLVPGLIVLSLVPLLNSSGSPTGAILSGNVLRMLFVLSGTLVVQSVLPHLRFREFIVWLLVFYLVTLLVETLLVLGLSQSSVHGALPPQDSAEKLAR